MKKMTLGSLFDGIGGWQLAGARNGIKPVWSSEIETFPIEVTKRRFPETKQLGDVTKINGADVEPVDIITSGSPCQDLSIANGGGRKGLDGERSGLFFDAIRIIREMRVSTGNVYPRFYIFENVPGTLSSNSGMDFRTILESITDTEIPIPRSGRWANAGLVRSRRADVGWRIIDAQYLRSTEGNFLLPQRRKRLWIVTDFAETGRCAEKILFECEGLSGNPEPVSEPRKRHSSNIEKSIDTTNRVINEGGNTIVKIRSGKDDGTAGKGALIGYESAFALSCTNDQFLFQNAGETRKIYDVTYDSEARETEVSPTLQARMGTGGNQVPILTENISGVLPFDRQQITSKTNRSNPQFGSVGHTLCGGSACNYGIIYALEGNGSIPSHQGNGYSDKGVMYTLNTIEQHAVAQQYAVRKLTPTECERLQSLPDGWTLIDHKSCTDSARYKALGNGMAQNVPDWILRRLVDVLGDKNENPCCV